MHRMNHVFEVYRRIVRTEYIDAICRRIRWVRNRDALCNIGRVRVVTGYADLRIVCSVIAMQ